MWSNSIPNLFSSLIKRPVQWIHQFFASAATKLSQVFEFISVAQAGKPHKSNPRKSKLQSLIPEDDEAEVLVEDNSSKFAEYVIDILLNPDSYNMLTTRARNFVSKHHSWDSHVSKLLIEYKNAIKK